MMKTILFDKSGKPLKVQFKVKNGVLVVPYTIELFDSNSNDACATFKGDNTNQNKDSFLLPLPVEENDGRLVQTTADFSGLDPNLSKQYSIGFEVYQGDVLLDSVFDDGALSSGEQNITLFATLKAQ